MSTSVREVELPPRFWDVVQAVRDRFVRGWPPETTEELIERASYFTWHIVFMNNDIVPIKVLLERL